MAEITRDGGLFKECPSCHKRWENRNMFLSDPEVRLVGYQVNYGELTAGFFLFNHDKPECGTSLAIQVEEFTDMHDGPIFEESIKGGDDCPGYCEHSNSLEPCYAKCECRYVRDVLQMLKTWPKD